MTFLEKFKVHRKIEGKVQRFPIYPQPHTLFYPNALFPLSSPLLTIVVQGMTDYLLLAWLVQFLVFQGADFSPFSKHSSKSGGLPQCLLNRICLSLKYTVIFSLNLFKTQI